MSIEPEDRQPYPRFGTDPASVRRRVEGLERVLSG